MDTQIRTRSAAWQQAADEEIFDGKSIDLSLFEWRDECLPRPVYVAPIFPGFQNVIDRAVKNGILEPVPLPRSRDFARACEDVMQEARRQEQENNRVAAAWVLK